MVPFPALAATGADFDFFDGKTGIGEAFGEGGLGWEDQTARMPAVVSAV